MSGGFTMFRSEPHQPGPGRSPTCWNSSEAEKIANVLAIKDFTGGEQFLLFATAKGHGEKNRAERLRQHPHQRHHRHRIGRRRFADRRRVTGGKDHIILGTKSGLAIRFEETDVRAMGRPAGGVTGARFKREGDEVVAMLVVPNGENSATEGPHRLRERLRQTHAAGGLSRQRPRNARASSTSTPTNATAMSSA